MSSEHAPLRLRHAWAEAPEGLTVLLGSEWGGGHARTMLALANARLSAASATGSAWKLAPESISSVSANASGLSDTAFASVNRIPAACRS